MSRSEPQPENRFTASVERLRQEFDRWVETAISQSGRALDRLGLRSGEKAWLPDVDILETPDQVQVIIDLPGVDPASVDVTLAGNMLTVKGEKAIISAGEGQSMHVRERSHGPFQRSIPLPISVNPETVTTDAQHGVIHLRFQKALPASSRQIQIAVQRPNAETPPL